MPTTYLEAIREGLWEEMERDPNVLLIGEDIGVEGGFGGAFGVYLSLTQEFGHDRIIDTPISEKVIAGAATGAALMGMRPIADMQYSDFLFECMDELVNQAAKMRYMSGGKLTVPLVMRAPVGATGRGAQHGQNLESFFLSVPGISGIYIGPSDMGLSLGMIPILDREEPVILEIYEKLVASCKKHGKFAGLHNGSASYAAKMIKMGFQLCTIQNDSGLMAKAAKEAVTQFRKEGGNIAG